MVMMLPVETTVFWGTSNVKAHFVMVQTIIKSSAPKELDTMINWKSKCSFKTRKK